jgi:hypothetical protein
MPGRMFEWSIYIRPRAGVIHQDHQANRSSPKDIERVKALVQVLVSFVVEDTKENALIYFLANYFSKV